ncbi:PhzF family phenazine biosynthesis protein [Stutzerimonas azotifigens]|uniref:PhzF family phenazine biosynthesis protein n=1 Tax=Stutzerimonas azotifigens TaxID=291995 RepID=A0ABR5Z6X4_9GAMM|nr:PhzF family phenazine biosynthesis protein [Stutzerimonas azotifigens]MBA1275982.1 PhzF family phenazine biosynthesis protein [Stutzerimonas azotifigens]
MQKRRFKQVDVFTRQPYLGNPLAVVLDAEGLDSEQMQAIARWTNLAETTFVLPPTDPQADYRVRIFSPETEFPFAGHPTLGTCHALLEAGVLPRTAGQFVQECGVGLVNVAKLPDSSLSFAAPQAALLPLDESIRSELTVALGTDQLSTRLPAVVVDMGIRWLVVRIDSAGACLAVTPDPTRMTALNERCQISGVALYGPSAEGEPSTYELRALLAEQGMLSEDPVTGSANACLARVLQSQGFPDPGTQEGYRVRQGTALKRNGQVSVRYLGQTPWVGGHSLTLVDGTLMA